MPYVRYTERKRGAFLSEPGHLLAARSPGKIKTGISKGCLSLEAVWASWLWGSLSWDDGTHVKDEIAWEKIVSAVSWGNRRSARASDRVHTPAADEPIVHAACHGVVRAKIQCVPWQITNRSLITPGRRSKHPSMCSYSCVRFLLGVIPASSE